MEYTKTIVCGTCGILGSWMKSLVGGWSSALQTLIIFMIIDYITGIIVAGVFKNSSKTETGTLESRIGWKGLCRKGMTLLIVLVAYQLEVVTGINWVRNAVIIAFISNETLSITENAGLMGISLPKPIISAIDILKKKVEDVEENNESSN